MNLVKDVKGGARAPRRHFEYGATAVDAARYSLSTLRSSSIEVSISSLDQRIGERVGVGGIRTRLEAIERGQRSFRSYLIYGAASARTRDVLTDSNAAACGSSVEVSARSLDDTVWGVGGREAGHRGNRLCSARGGDHCQKECKVKKDAHGSPIAVP